MKTHVVQTARAERRAMGVSCVVTVVGQDAAVIAHHCLDNVQELEHLWSRFDSNSDISRLNSANGSPIWVDSRTTQILQHVVLAHGATKGLFNPTRLPLQIAAGDKASLIDDGVTRISPLAHAFDDLSLITFHDDGRITIPAEMTLDLGGIAKGYAADVTMQYALSQGATGACVNIGGDMAMNTGDDAGWDVEVLAPNDYSHTVDTVRVARGGIATSSLFARSRDNKGIASHVFGTDGPHRTDQTVGATVIANSAAWAEAWTKAAILAEPTDAITTLNELGLAAMLVANDGSVLCSKTWDDFTHE